MQTLLPFPSLSKRCPSCRTELSVESFCRDRTQADGRSRICRSCSKVQQAEWRREHPGQAKRISDKSHEKRRERTAGARSEAKAAARVARAVTRSYVGEKRCYKCRTVKPIGDFHRAKSECRRCNADARTAWREQNPDLERARDAAYRVANADKVRARAAEYRSRMPAAVLAKKKAYEQQPERKAKKRSDDQLRLKSPAYRLELRERSKKWRAANPGRHRENHRRAKHLRRARLKQVPRERFLDREIFERDGWVCQICGRPVKREARCPDPDSPSLDHRIPLAKGGGHVRANVQLAHFWCNSIKSDSLPDAQAPAERGALQPAGPRPAD